MRLEHKRTREKWAADRVKAVFLPGSGWSVGDVAEALMVDENTVRDYFQKWKSGEIDTLRKRNPESGWTKIFVKMQQKSACMFRKHIEFISHGRECVTS